MHRGCRTRVSGVAVADSVPPRGPSPAASPAFPQISLLPCKARGHSPARRGDRASWRALLSAYAHALWLPSGRVLWPTAFRKAPLIGPATQATPATTLDGQLLTCLVSFRGLALKTRGGAGGFIRTPPDLVSGNFLEKKLELCPTSPKTQIPGLKLILEPKGENT